jgi:predicted transcriptional regulator
MTARKKLPIGIQSLREIREDGHYYVDKTPYALRLVEQRQVLLPLSPAPLWRAPELSTR